MKNLKEFIVSFDNNFYEMGKGWVESDKVKTDFMIACSNIAEGMGMEYFPEHSMSASTAHNVVTLERIYFHPMRFNLTLREDNMELFFEIIKMESILSNVSFKEISLEKTQKEFEDDIRSRIRYVDMNRG